MKLEHPRNGHLLFQDGHVVHRVLYLLLFYVQERLSLALLGFQPSVVLQLLRILLVVLLLLHRVQIERQHRVLQRFVLLPLLVLLLNDLFLAALLDLSGDVLVVL